jgi:hypothetical protein
MRRRCRHAADAITISTTAAPSSFPIMVSVMGCIMD